MFYRMDLMLYTRPINEELLRSQKSESSRQRTNPFLDVSVIRRTENLTSEIRPYTYQIKPLRRGLDPERSKPKLCRTF